MGSWARRDKTRAPKLKLDSNPALMIVTPASGLKLTFLLCEWGPNAFSAGNDYNTQAALMESSDDSYTS